MKKAQVTECRSLSYRAVSGEFKAEYSTGGMFNCIYLKQRVRMSWIDFGSIASKELPDLIECLQQMQMALSEGQKP